MPSSQTPNYSLSQWERADKILMDDFNADNAKIDAALRAHDAALNRRGNCQLYTASYTGNGETGPDGARSLTFPKTPQIVFVCGNGGWLALVPGVSASPAIAHASILDINVAWNGNSVSWYGGSNGAIMMNAKDVTYYVVALLVA